MKSKHVAQTWGRCSLRAHLLLGSLLLGWGISGCEETSSSGQTEGIVDAWRQSGLTPTVFAKLEDENLKPGTCQQGRSMAFQ